MRGEVDNEYECVGVHVGVGASASARVGLWECENQEETHKVCILDWIIVERLSNRLNQKYR